MAKSKSALESQALVQFDRLVEAGELLWTEVPPRHVSSVPFNFEFRVAASLTDKPMTASQKKVKNAFEDDNPDFYLGAVGPAHKLILNKFCVTRPQFVLPTVEFESQSKALSSSDLGAAWDVLSRLNSEYIAIFNCGPDGGASVGHKHMQIIPHPGRDRFELFPDMADLGGGKGNDIYACPTVPFQHAMQRLPPIVNANVLQTIYQNLATSLSLDLSQEKGTHAPHNMIMVKRWLMVVPRTKGCIGEVTANAAAMVGMLWLTTEEQYQTWTEGDPMGLLAEFGVPKGTEV